MQEMLFDVVGGLALFLLGMGMLSDGLKRAAGDRLRTTLEHVTRWPIIAMLTGAAVTAFVQSSSITSVMVVGLINAGLLTLKQGISVVIGANVGTTFTAWLVAAVSMLKVMKISAYAMPFLAIGFGLREFGRRPKYKNTGNILIGLGLLFLGLAVMKEGMDILNDGGQMTHILQVVGDRPLVAILAGAAVTMIVQSSSAVVAMILLIAASNGFGSDPEEAFRISIPFVLGSNIGTTITAQLAALQSNLSGKRAAMAHTMFNVLGVAIVLPMVYTDWFAQFVNWVYPTPLTMNNIEVHIAIAHTAFNVFAAIVMLPLISQFEMLVLKIMPTRAGHMDEMPVTLERHLLDTPPMAFDQARREMCRMIHTAQAALDSAIAALVNNDFGALKQVSKKEEALDNFQAEITRYLVELSQRPLEPWMAGELPVLLHSVNDLERVGDHAVNISEIAQRKIDQKQTFSPEAMAEIDRMKTEVNFMFSDVLKAVEENDSDAAQHAMEHEKTINRIQIDARRDHIERLSKGNCDAMAGLTFIDYINNMEKIGDHLSNVAEGAMDEFQWSKISHEDDPEEAATLN
jgi:phosphate:Na+ symporter